jgi:outer membrane protein
MAALVATAGLFHARYAHAAPLTLEDAIARALSTAPAIAQARAASDLSDAGVREQFAPLLPNLTASSEYYQAPGYNEIITNRGLSSAMLTLDYTAWDWGRRSAQWRAARYASEAATLGVAAARAQIVFDTSVAYYDLTRTREADAELRASLERLNRYVATVEQLRRSGRAIANDVLKIESARDSAELALATAHSNRRRASAVLGALIGDYTAGDIEIASLTGIPSLSGGEIDQSPEVRAAQRSISAATLQVKAAKAEWLPTFKVALTTGFLGIDPPATVNHNYGASYDGVISMPLFQGGLVAAHVDQAKARELSAVAQLRQAKYLLSRRIADASARYDQARDELTILAHAQPTADDAFALTWTRFLGGGNATLLEVLDAYQQAEQLRLVRFDQEYAARAGAAETALLYGRTEAP